RSIRVPLPPPDGELTTINIPRPVLRLAALSSPAVISSFNILHLFAKFLNFSLDRERRIFDRNLSRFSQHRVGFAIEFLQKKVETFADFAINFQRRAKLFDVAAQAR